MDTTKKLCLLALCILTANGMMAQWTKLPPFTQNNLTDIAFSNPDTGVATGENGTVYRTYDGGQSWEFISPEKDVTYTSVALTSARDFYVSGYKTFEDGSGVTNLYYSADAGQTWKIINSYDVVGERTQVRCERGNIWLLGAWKGLQKSTDGGRSWDLEFKGGGTTVLTDLLTDRSNPESIFTFGTIGGFATYSTTFRHSVKSGKWNIPDPFDFDNASAYTAFDVIHDTVILFRNHFHFFMPNDTSNVLSVMYDFVRDDIIPGAATGDTAWHFKIKTINDHIPHYVTGCHFFSLTGLAYSIENVGGINKTMDGGKSWSRVYTSTDPLTALFMLSDSSGYVVGEKGTVIRFGSASSSRPDYPDNGLSVRVYPSPATDRIIIERTGSVVPATLVILNASGSEITSIQLSGSQEQVDISALPAGIYYLSVRQGGKVIVRRIIRE